MIERLATTLSLLADFGAGEEAVARRSAIAGDYSDALRLVIDCPQIRLEPEQQAALERVEDALEREPVDADRVRELARAALVALLRHPENQDDTDD